MQFIETALAFAVTMLVLSLVVSAFVELIHRVFSMREAGLKYMLGEVFDQVLARYVSQAKLEAWLTERSQQVPQPRPPVQPSIRDRILEWVFGKVPSWATAKTTNLVATPAMETLRQSFVERMSANRTPMGVNPVATLDRDAKPAGAKPATSNMLRLWNGRDLAAMTPAEFMERLGTINIGEAVREANEAANSAGVTAADAVDVVLKDVAQKFEAFGKEAGSYFEGRARLLSVLVAISFALVVHVDAIDIFKTFLRDPNVRAKVVEKTEAVLAQQRQTEAILDAARKLSPPAKATAPAEGAQNAAPGGEASKAEVEKFEKLKADLQAEIDKTKKTTAQLADLGVPIGWTDAAVKSADAALWLWTCKKLPLGVEEKWGTFRQECRENESTFVGNEGRQYVNVWLQMPRDIATIFSLLLGGFLIGLGSPFWYRAVTGLTDIRKIARGTASAEAQSGLETAATVAQIERAQPVTPVGAFHVSKMAKNHAKK